MKMKLDRIERNFERLIVIGVNPRMAGERTRLVKSIEGDIDRLNKDI